MSIDMLTMICKDDSDIEVKPRDAPLGVQLGIMFGVHEITHTPMSAFFFLLKLISQHSDLVNKEHINVILLVSVRTF